MSHTDKTKDQLLEELTGLNQRVVKLEAAEVERQQVEEGLKQSEERYRLLVETMNEGLAQANQDYVFTYVNDRFCEMLGYSRDELIEHHLIEFIHDDYRELMQDQMARRRKGEGKRFELAWTAKDGHKIYTLVSPRGYYDEEGRFKGSLGILADITDLKNAEEALQKAHDELERRVEERTAQLLRANKQLKHEIEERSQAEEALRESEERFRSIFEKSRDAICLIDSEGRYLMVNDAMCELTGVSRGELVNKHYSTFMDKETHELMEQYWLRRQRNQPAPDRYEFKLIRTDGDIRIIDNVPTVIYFQDKPPLTLAILRDVTERRRMEDALESMRSKLLNLQESERSKISRVLHDTIGQNIGILDFNLATIVEILDETSRESISGLIDNMRNVIRETGDKLRDISSGLHPRLVQELGLVAGVRNLIDRFQGATWIEVHSSIQINELHIDESVAVNLYRIVQEALTNIVKHSKCSSVLFEMAVEDDRLGVMVKDNGTGFSLEDVSQRDIEQRGMGLFIMEERAKAIGGRLQIHSESDQGTKVQVEVELEST
jgi:PAS domain S-box-containing protein